VVDAELLRTAMWIITALNYWSRLHLRSHDRCMNAGDSSLPGALATVSLLAQIGARGLIPPRMKQ